jgi:hypothetical protein
VLFTVTKTKHGRKSAGAKAQLCWAFTARLKSCPDTKHLSSDSQKIAHSVNSDLSTIFTMHKLSTTHSLRCFFRGSWVDQDDDTLFMGDMAFIRQGE